MINPSVPLVGRHLSKAQIFDGPIRPQLVNGTIRGWVSHVASPEHADLLRQEVHHMIVTHGPNEPIIQGLLDPGQPMPTEKTHAWWTGERREVPGEHLHTTLALHIGSQSKTEPDMAVKIIDGEYYGPKMVLRPSKILTYLSNLKVPCVQLLGYVFKDKERQPDLSRKLEYPARGEFFVKWEKNAVPLNDRSVRPLFRIPEKRQIILKQLADLFAFFHGRHNPYTTESRKSHLPVGNWDILINDCKLENFLFVPEAEEKTSEPGKIKVLDPELWEIRKKSEKNEEEKELDIKNLMLSAHKDGLVRNRADVEGFVRQYLGLHLNVKNKDQKEQAKAWDLTVKIMDYLKK